MRLLAVDDHDGSASMLQLYLELVHETAEIATSIEQARELIAISPFDGLIIDYLLRGKETGLDLLRWCRASGIKTPAVIVTAVSADQLEVIQFHVVTESLGPAAVMAKPAEPEAMLKTIRTLMKGN